MHLKCVGNHIVIGEPVTQLYKTSRELLSYGEELTLTGETVDMRFSFPLPDHHDCFLPSFQLGSRRVTWFVFATVELANGAVYRCVAPLRDRSAFLGQKLRLGPVSRCGFD